MALPVLLVGTSGELIDQVGQAFRSGGFLPSVASNLSEALEKVFMELPLLAVVDFSENDASGFIQSMIGGIRRVADVPIIAITGQDKESARLEALRSGADDCLSLPVAPEELVARARAISRRLAGVTATRRNDLCRLASDVVVDLGAREVIVKGTPHPLTAFEFRLLHYFIQNPGRLLSRQQIWYATHEGGDYMPSNEYQLRSTIWRLRRKLGETRQPGRFIIGRRGQGYIFKYHRPANQGPLRRTS
ncbi:MAG: response regulator transcription factor [Chloroflexota bacterium]